eukprot:403354117
MQDYGATRDGLNDLYYPNALDDHNNVFFNHDDLCRAFQDSERNGYQSQAAEDLLSTLTGKFSKLLEALKQEESEKKKYQKQVLELQTQLNSYMNFKDVLNVSELARENENLKSRISVLENEIKLINYEKNRLDKTFDEMKRKVEERVPIINEVEKRRIELEHSNLDLQSQMKNLQDQLKETTKKCGKLSTQLNQSQKQCIELETELRSHKERMSALRNMNVKYEQKIKFLQEDFQRVLGDDTYGVRDLKDKCIQLELDNRELTKHIKILLETQSENSHIELYKQKIVILENKLGVLSQQNIELIDKIMILEEDKFVMKQQENQTPNINKAKEKDTSYHLYAPLQMPADKQKQKPQKINDIQIIEEAPPQQNPTQKLIHHYKQPSDQSNIQSDFTNPMKSYTSNSKPFPQKPISNIGLNNQQRMNINELRAINISKCDLRMSLDENQIELEIKAITERSSQLEASHQQTFGDKDLFYKMNRSEVKQMQGSHIQILDNMGQDDDLDEVLSLKPEKLDLESLNLSTN